MDLYALDRYGLRTGNGCRDVSLDLCRNPRPETDDHSQRYQIKKFVRYHQCPSFRSHHENECSVPGTIGVRMKRQTHVRADHFDPETTLQ